MPKKLLTSKFVISFLIILAVLLPLNLYKISSGLSLVESLKVVYPFLIPFAIFLINFVLFFDFLQKKRPNILKELAPNISSKSIKFSDIGFFDFFLYGFSLKKKDDTSVKLHKLIHILSSILAIVFYILFLVNTNPSTATLTSTLS
ncbi:MAG: hypothetical protein ACFFG0_55435 [Candidatus Thorarchaeota archaeon]